MFKQTILFFSLIMLFTNPVSARSDWGGTAARAPRVRSGKTAYETIIAVQPSAAQEDKYASILLPVMQGDKQIATASVSGSIKASSRTWIKVEDSQKFYELHNGYGDTDRYVKERYCGKLKPVTPSYKFVSLDLASPLSLVDYEPDKLPESATIFISYSIQCWDKDDQKINHVLTNVVVCP